MKLTRLFISAVSVAVALVVGSATVLQAAVVPVSGGGAALSAAITAAQPNDEIEITDSSTNYAMGAIKMK